jgi:hypothetical protein
MTLNTNIDSAEKLDFEKPGTLTKQQRKWIWLFVLTIGVIIAVCICDLRKHYLPDSWHGTSTGIFGGTIGALVFIFHQIIDHETFLLSDLGRGPAKNEHLSYIQGRTIFGISSGFILSAIIASIFPSATDACLMAFGMIGGFSITFLPTMTAATDTATRKYFAGEKNMSV